MVQGGASYVAMYIKEQVAIAEYSPCRGQSWQMKRGTAAIIEFLTLSWGGGAATK